MNGIHSEAQRQIDGITAKSIKLQSEKVGEAGAGTTTNAVAFGGATVGLTMMAVQFLAKSFISALSKSIMKLLQWTKEFLTKKRHLFYIKSDPSEAIKSIENSASQTSTKPEVRQGISLRQKVWKTIKSLKDFIFKRSEGKVEISEEIAGNKQEQAQKFLRLLNTPAGEPAPAGLEKMKVTIEGKNLIVVDRQGMVIANDIQPLMATETFKAAWAEHQVELPNAPQIEPIPGSSADPDQIKIRKDNAEKEHDSEWYGQQEITPKLLADFQFCNNLKSIAEACLKQQITQDCKAKIPFPSNSDFGDLQTFISYRSHLNSSKQWEFFFSIDLETSIEKQSLVFSCDADGNVSRITASERLLNGEIEPTQLIGNIVQSIKNRDTPLIDSDRLKSKQALAKQHPSSHYPDWYCKTPAQAKPELQHIQPESASREAKLQELLNQSSRKGKNQEQSQSQTMGQSM